MLLRDEYQHVFVELPPPSRLQAPPLHLDIAYDAPLLPAKQGRLRILILILILILFFSLRRILGFFSDSSGTGFLRVLLLLAGRLRSSASGLPALVVLGRSIRAAQALVVAVVVLLAQRLRGRALGGSAEE